MTLKQMALAGAGCFALGLGSGWALWHPRAPIQETPALAARQKDSSLVLARAPDAKAKPPAIVPKGDKLGRVVSATVQPRPVSVDSVWVIRHDTTPGRVDTVRAAAELPSGDKILCPPVRFGLTLVKAPDGTERVIASSPDGRVVDGLDVPVAKALPPPRPLPWSAGALYGPNGNGFGAYASRDLGPVRIIVGGLQGSAKGGVVMAGVGLRF